MRYPQEFERGFSMKKYASILLTLLLVILLGMAGLPIRTQASILDDLGFEQNNMGRYTIQSFDELRLVASQTYDTVTECEYISNFLYVEESLSIPQNLHLYTKGYDVCVAKGVTLTINGEISAGTIEIDGACICNGTLSINSGLKVSGSLVLNGNLLINDCSIDKIKYAENIQYGDNGYVTCRNYLSNMQEIKNVANDAKTFQNERWQYDVIITLSDKNIVVNESVEFPQNCNISIVSFSLSDAKPGIIIEEGCAFTIK